MISFNFFKYGSLTIETQGEKALIMNRKRFKIFANGASFKMGHPPTHQVELGIPDETGDSASVKLIHLKEGEDNYSLTVNVDGLEVGRTSCCSGMLRNLTDVRIIISDSGYGGDLIVLDKA